MLIDSNLIIYATQPQHHRLRRWLAANATHYSVISRLETLGYQQLTASEAAAIDAVLNNLGRLAIDDMTIDLAIGLRQQRKMSLGDALIAATCMAHQLPLASANEKDFDWIAGLQIHNPMASSP